MKKLLALALAAAVFAVPATQVSAASGPTAAQFKALQKQVTKLQNQVKTLQKQVAEAQEIGLAGFIVGLCATAVTADALQGTWQAIDAREATRGGAPIFGAQTPINDAQACSAWQVTRSHAVPPTVSAFTEITAETGAYRFSALRLLLG